MKLQLDGGHLGRRDVTLAVQPLVRKGKYAGELARRDGQMLHGPAGEEAQNRAEGISGEHRACADDNEALWRWG